MVVAALLSVFYLGPFQRQITGFFRLGGGAGEIGARTGRTHLRYPGQTGYDGQFYLAIALDPAGARPETFRFLDNADYRYRRILLPALAFLAGAGRPRLIPWTFVALDGCAAVVLTVLVAAIARDRGRHPAWGLLVLSCPGLWASLLFSTPDLLASTWTFAGIFLVGRGRHAGAAMAFALAALAKETALITFLCVVLWLVWSAGPRRAATLLVAPLPAIAWIAWLYGPVGRGGGTTGVVENFALPLTGLCRAIVAGGDGETTAHLAFDKATLVATLFAVAVLAWKGVPALPGLGRAIGGAYAVLVVLLSRQMLEGHLSHARSFLDVAILLALGADGSWTRRLATFALSLFTAIVLALYLHGGAGARVEPGAPLAPVERFCRPFGENQGSGDVICTMQS